MSTIPYTVKFNRMGEWARQQSLFKLRDTYVASGFRGCYQQNESVHQLFEQFAVFLLFISFN